MLTGYSCFSTCNILNSSGIFLTAAFILFYQFVYVGDSSTSVEELLINWQLVFVLFFALMFLMLPIYFYKRFYFHFGQDVINSLRKGNYEDLYMLKILRGKLQKYVYMVRAVFKFKKIFKKSLDFDGEDANLADIKIKRIVDLYKMDTLGEVKPKRRLLRRGTSSAYISSVRRKKEEQEQEKQENSFDLDEEVPAPEELRDISEVSMSREDRTMTLGTFRQEPANTQENERRDLNKEIKDISTKLRSSIDHQFKSHFDEDNKEEVVFLSKMDFKEAEKRRNKEETVLVEKNPTNKNTFEDIEEFGEIEDFP